eukprot:jgi/Tetstr1/446995/TSEL_034453.t1
MCHGRLRGLHTQPVGTNGPPLHKLVGANEPPLHHVLWSLPRWSAPTDRHCSMCPGRFRGPGTQLAGAIDPPLHDVPRLLSQLRPATQLVGADLPPLHHAPRFDVGGVGGGPACDYIIDFACVSSTTPTWGNDLRWCTPGIAATEAERNKLAADRASSAPVQGVQRYLNGSTDE